MSTPGANDSRLDAPSRPGSVRPDPFPGGTPKDDGTPEQHDSEAKEVKTLAEEYMHLDLDALAPITRIEEGNNHADRFRSVFGFIWLRKACGMHHQFPLNPPLAHHI